MKISYQYIFLLAIRNMIMFENNRDININNLIDYYVAYIEETLIELAQSYTNIEINKDIIYNKLKEFIHDYKDYFYYDEETNNVIIFNNINLKDINKLVDNYNYHYIFDVISASKKCLKCLKINKINKSIFKYNKIEKELEKTYLELKDNPDNQNIKNKITKLLIKRSCFIYTINNMNKTAIRACYEESYDYMERKNYYVYYEPLINEEKYLKSKYYNEENDIRKVLFDIGNYEIFNDRITHFKLTHELIDLIWQNKTKDLNIFLNNLNENLEEEDIPEDEIVYINYDDSWIYEEYAFYLKYIEKLNNYIRETGKKGEFENIKYRLLYSLDTINTCLFDDECFKRKIEEINDYNFNFEGAFEYFKNIACYFLEELFNNKKIDNTTTKKLLFISTYYDFTEDEEILNILDENKNNEFYDYYSNIIFNNFNKGFSKELKQ